MDPYNSIFPQDTALSEGQRKKVSVQTGVMIEWGAEQNDLIENTV